MICIIDRKDVKTSFYDYEDQAQEAMKNDFFNWIDPLDLPGQGFEVGDDVCGCCLMDRYARISDKWWLSNVEWYIIDIWRNGQFYTCYD